VPEALVVGATGRARFRRATIKDESYSATVPKNVHGLCLEPRGINFKRGASASPATEPLRYSTRLITSEMQKPSSTACASPLGRISTPCMAAIRIRP